MPFPSMMNKRKKQANSGKWKGIWLGYKKFSVDEPVGFTAHVTHCLMNDIPYSVWLEIVSHLKRLAEVHNCVHIGSMCSRNATKNFYKSD